MRFITLLALPAMVMAIAVPQSSQIEKRKQKSGKLVVKIQPGAGQCPPEDAASTVSFQAGADSGCRWAGLGNALTDVLRVQPDQGFYGKVSIYSDFGCQTSIGTWDLSDMDDGAVYCLTPAQPGTTFGSWQYLG